MIIRCSSSDQTWHRYVPDGMNETSEVKAKYKVLWAMAAAMFTVHPDFRDMVDNIRWDEVR